MPASGELWKLVWEELSAYFEPVLIWQENFKKTSFSELVSKMSAGNYFKNRRQLLFKLFRQRLFKNS